MHDFYKLLNIAPIALFSPASPGIFDQTNLRLVMNILVYDSSDKIPDLTYFGVKLTDQNFFNWILVVVVVRITRPCPMQLVLTAEGSVFRFAILHRIKKL